MVFEIIRALIKVLMAAVRTILNQKAHYLNVPDEILPLLKTERIVRVWHFLPSLILSILFVVKVLPLVSSDYAKELDDNSTVIPIAFVISFLFVLVLIGFVIEKLLTHTNAKYAEYVKET